MRKDAWMISVVGGVVAAFVAVLLLGPTAVGHRRTAVKPGWRLDAQVVRADGTTSGPMSVRRAHRKIDRNTRLRMRARWRKTPIMFSGAASWYGPGFEGNTTACGETFDPSQLTTAHRTLPCGTRLVVASGGREVLVRVNDRGPFIEGRVLDLSRAAFERLAPLGAGTVQVSARRP